MARYLPILFLLTWLTHAEIYAQADRYTVKVAPFSSRIHDEFSPVFYQGGIVFCSNQSNNTLVSYQDEQNGLFKIFFVAQTNSTGWKQPKIFSRDITTDVNDGPVTFSKDECTVYYARNNSVEKLMRNISDTGNKLGIYSAELADGRWTNIKPFPYNDPKYSFCTPALAPDGERIYFSSDMPGGSGGMDLYYCDRRNNGWDRPVNMGTVINTSKNESFPFAGRYGKLFFASDGHPGYGGKDLFYTQEINGEWIVPVHLDSAINSPADDFGLVADSTFEQGYFSTNRRKTDDIFSFNSAPVEFPSCDTIKENNYCFTFYDEQRQLIDTIPVIYQWDFGNGIKRTGAEVRHCFPGSGRYTVKLSITDELTGKAIAEQVEYEVELEDIRQAYINSYNAWIVDKSLSFDAGKSNLEGFRVTDYLWDFGNGFKSGQPFMNYTFEKKGEYTVRLGLLGEKDSQGIIPKTCAIKKIRVYDHYEEMALKEEREEDARNDEADAGAVQTKTMQIRVYFMDDLSERQKEKIRSELTGTGISTVMFDQYGIKPSSIPFLDDVAAVLQNNPEIRLEMVLRADEEETQENTMDMSEKCAQELAFYFKRNEINLDASHFRGMDSSNPAFSTTIPDNNNMDGIMELLFMKN
jgi:outer membrane protein OmpA-like peptidoglycan-associated protein